MSYQELKQYKDQHGRITYINKLGYQNVLFGYIREIYADHIVWEDNERSYKFKVRNVISFTLFNLQDKKLLL